MSGSFNVSIRFIRYFFRYIGRLTPVWGLLILVVAALGLLIARIEGFKALEGLYFAWVTGLTIGYGDLTPSQPLSRLFALAIGLAGIIFSGIWVAAAVAAVRSAVLPSAGEENASAAPRKEGDEV